MAASATRSRADIPEVGGRPAGNAGFEAQHIAVPWRVAAPVC